MPGIDPISAGLNLVNSVVDRIWPNASDALKAKAALAQLEATGELKTMALQAGLAQAQIATNTAEAATGKLFIAGWRPFLGWVCGGAFAWAYVIEPLVRFGLSAAGHPVVLPTLSLSAMTPVLFGMLGLGGMRSFEKSKGVEGRHG